jgi:hypothetical protein
MIERDEMSKKFEDSNFIGYVCEDQDEIINLQRLNINQLKISKKRFHDDYYEMHLIEGIKEKTVTLTFNEKLTLDNTNNSMFNKISLFYLPKQYKSLIMHFIDLIQNVSQNHDQQQFQSGDSFVKHYFDIVYFKLITNYLLLKYFFTYKKFLKKYARLVRMCENA